MEFEKTPEISSINYMEKSNLGSNVESRVIPNEKSLEAKTRIRPLVESDGVKRFGGETVWRP